MINKNYISLKASLDLLCTSQRICVKTKLFSKRSSFAVSKTNGTKSFLKCSLFENVFKTS